MYIGIGEELHRQVVAIDVAAMRGEAVPSKLTSRLTVNCLVRGIRFHDGFAQELHGHSELPRITRSLNARAIMSNRVPEMHCPGDFPYCFWHPDIPREQTLRDLLRKYPKNTLLPYQVARACAAGGYTDLYHELGVLPDVAIAEEARDNIRSGQAIYKAIMDAPIRYAYMNDYTCSLREHPIPGAHLNGDTCIRSTLNKRLPREKIWFGYAKPLSFDITEDQRVDNYGTLPEECPVDPEAVRLLYSPLPADLPTVDKDLLILMAAWTGNIDRYLRLRRPEMILGEYECVIRGIHHVPFFAKWWLLQLDEQYPDDIGFYQAVYARCVMNNDLSWLSDATPESHLPEMIWFPHCAASNTYLEIVRRRPSMVQVVARACIHADYQEAFDSINWEPHTLLWQDAQVSKNTHYLESIERKAQQIGINCEEDFLDPWDEISDWRDEHFMRLLGEEWRPYRHMGAYSLRLCREIMTPFSTPDTELMGEKYCTIGEVLLHACVANPLILPSPPYTELDLWKLYSEPGISESEEDRRKRCLR